MTVTDHIAPPVRPELLERSAELRTLAGSLADVKQGRRGRMVVVRGEAGIGKTALL